MSDTISKGTVQAEQAQEYWSGQPIPSPGDLSDPGIEPGSHALQVDFSPAELPGKPRTRLDAIKTAFIYNL